MKVEDMLYLENKYELNKKRYNGFSYWTYERFQIMRYVEGKKKRIPINDARISCSNLIVDVWNIALRFIKKRYMPKKKADVCIFNHERRVLRNGYYDCIYTEEIAQKFSSSVVIESPYGLHHLEPTRTRNLYYCDKELIISCAIASIKKGFKVREYVKIHNILKVELKEVIDEIEKIDEIIIDRDEFIDFFAYYYFVYQYRKKYYEKVLDIIEPKIIIEVVGYKMDCMIVNELSKRMGIPTIELQHGTMGQGHIAYNYNQGEKIPQFPDKLLLFSDYWKKCTNFPILKKDVVAVGYPYFEEQLKKYQCVKKYIDRRKKTILFLSQWIIGEDLSKLAVELYSLMDNKDIHIIYKLHPGEYNGWEKRYPELAGSGIEVVDTLDHNVYEYFAISDIQVGVFSTAIYEGLGFGLETYIYQTNYSEYMNELCVAGYAKMVKSAKELQICLNKNEKQNKLQTTDFWKNDALNNTYKAIEKCMSYNS